MGLLKELKERGFVHQSTNEEDLNKLLSSEDVTAFIGFDATADSLHVGSLLQIMILRKLKQFGHNPIALLGGATTKIGDPSGKDQSRKMLSEEDIKSNSDGIKDVFNRCIPGIEVVNNNEWLGEMGFVDVLREVGPHFTINRMTSFESVKNRISREQGITFLEFNYMILQAIDFNWLNANKNCQLQIGGSDQWGNIVCGIDLIKKKQGKSAFGLTTPLIQTASGQKMGKTETGAVWLSEDRTSVFDFWQFWRNVDDRDVERFFKFFTDLPLERIAELNFQGPEINLVKIALATEVTTIVHGLEKALLAQEQAESIFLKGETKDLPVFEITTTDLEKSVFHLFFESGLCKSKSEARRLIRGNGASIDGVKIEDENRSVRDFVKHKGCWVKFKISRKKKHVLVKVI